MFLKRKCCGKRSRAKVCRWSQTATVHSKRRYNITHCLHRSIPKEDTTSPTVCTEAVFLTAVIDAMENDCVAIMDVPGVFRQVDMDKTVHVHFTGEMACMLLEIDMDLYQEYITIEKGEKVIYVKLLKALYGTLKAPRLFWEKLSHILINKWGFTVNNYDGCVVNKIVQGSQLTVMWHVDDLKVSHTSQDIVDKFIHDMEHEFNKESLLSVSTKKQHN